MLGSISFAAATEWLMGKIYQLNAKMHISRFRHVETHAESIHTVSSSSN